MRGDLIRILHKILKRKTINLDAIIIETTGLADPAPVAQTFFMDDAIKARVPLQHTLVLWSLQHTHYC